MKIEEISAGNIDSLTKLVIELWPACIWEEERKNCGRIAAAANETCFLVKKEGDYIAFIYLNMRFDYVEGTISSPVAYVEGIYVKEAYRRAGIGKKLVAYCELWAKERGCGEYASDTEWDNQASIAFHKNTGFKEAGRQVCFVKKI